MRNSLGGEKSFTQYNETFDGIKFHNIIESSDQDIFDDNS